MKRSTSEQVILRQPTIYRTPSELPLQNLQPNTSKTVETLNDIEFIKTIFQSALHTIMGLTRVSAPLFLPKSTGLNDDLNGTERKVTFTSRDGTELEIVQSLAKWKRYALGKYGLSGLYTDMNAIRIDELTDNIHSIYVDQWDWEAVIPKERRDIDTLIVFVNEVFKCIKDIDTKLSFKHHDRRELLEGISSIYYIQLSDLVRFSFH